MPGGTPQWPGEPYRGSGDSMNLEGVMDEMREAFATSHEPIAVPEPIDTTEDLDAVRKRLGLTDGETPDLASFSTGPQVSEDATPPFSPDAGVSADDLLKG